MFNYCNAPQLLKRAAADFRLLFVYSGETMVGQSMRPSAV